MNSGGKTLWIWIIPPQMDAVKRQREHSEALPQKRWPAYGPQCCKITQFGNWEMMRFSVSRDKVINKSGREKESLVYWQVHGFKKSKEDIIWVCLGRTLNIKTEKWIKSIYSLDTTPEGLRLSASSSLCGNMANTCSWAQIIYTHTRRSDVHTHTHTRTDAPHADAHWLHDWLRAHICTLQ